MAARLTERAEGTITVDDVKNSTTIEALATIVREHLEAGELEGFVRTLRAKPSSPRLQVLAHDGGQRLDGRRVLHIVDGEVPSARSVSRAAIFSAVSSSSVGSGLKMPPGDLPVTMARRERHPAASRGGTSEPSASATASCVSTCAAIEAAEA